MRSQSIHSSMEDRVSWEWVCVGLWVGVAAELASGGMSPISVSAPLKRSPTIIHTVVPFVTPCAPNEL